MPAAPCRDVRTRCEAPSRHDDLEIEDMAAANVERMNAEAGRVVKPTKTSPGRAKYSPGEDGKGRRNWQKSGAEKMMPGRRRQSLQRLNNPCDALWGRAGGEAE
ncbi:hypothetical protein NDU88_007762 [Pleurodeles waltl]|uniref:Uncharacterized protein n=1 Tax=Pleurodeles waltl TaxID=8319 RepID=A0AAV7PML0_PLEWA|nr:hypothetical protein NDU88_007762 [Pleurodeles waltl]